MEERTDCLCGGFVMALNYRNVLKPGTYMSVDVCTESQEAGV